MAHVPDKINSLIKHFISALRQNNIHVSQAILFGSYAQGKYNEWSDIDLALVSDDFVGDRFVDRNRIRKIKLSISTDLEPIPFTSETFSRDDPFVQRIIETGVVIS